jgi:hypothetical protein
MRNQVAVDVERGRIAFAVGDVPQDLTVTYHYGFSGDLGGGPYDRLATLSEPDPDSWQVSLHDDSETSLQAAIAAWLETGCSRALIRITENVIYEAPDNTIEIEIGDGRTLIIEAADGVQPVLAGDLRVEGGGVGAVLVINGLLIDGSIELHGSLDLTIRHTTLVPLYERSSIWYGGGDPSDLRVSLSFVIAGPLRLPADAALLAVTDSIVGTLGPPPRHSVLVSGSLSSFNGLSASPGPPELAASLSNRDARSLIVIDGSATTMAKARESLHNALRAASDDPAFTAAEVTLRRKRLIILAGTPVGISFAATENDATTVSELRLDTATAGTVHAVISAPLNEFSGLTAIKPEVAVTIAAGTTVRGPFIAGLESAPTTLVQARNGLEGAIRSAGDESALSEALVTTVGDRLLVVAGAAGADLGFSATDDDTTTVCELGLDAWGPPADLVWGPPAMLARTTVLGTVTMRELTASEVLFTRTVEVERRHSGSVRYSYLPQGSVTARRFRCQPELAVSRAVAEQLPALLARELPAALEQGAGNLGLDSAAELSQPQRDQVEAELDGDIRRRIERRVRQRIQVALTSVDPADPAYAQLSKTAAVELRTGAEDGTEIGAFCFLRQPQRHAQLRALIDEYVRFGLEVGLFYVT